MIKNPIFYFLPIFTVVIFLTLFFSVNIVSADSAWFYPPECSYSDNYFRDNGDRPTPCGYFEERFYIDNIDALKDTAHVYSWAAYMSSTNDFFLATSTIKLDTNPYKTTWHYFAFEKKQLQSATGSSDPMSILESTMVIDEAFTGDKFMTQVVSSSPEVQRGLMDFFVLQNDKHLGLYAVGTSTAAQMSLVSDDHFIKLYTYSIDPYVKTSVTDPRKEVHLFYSPLGVYEGNKIILYNSKEIQILDDGSEKIITFEPPVVPGIVPVARVALNTQTGDLATTTPSIQTSRPWWSSFWCFLKGIFGNSC